MKTTRAFALAVGGVVCLVAAAISTADAKAAPKRRPRRSNPAMKPITDTPGLSRVLLIGDSISIGYTLDTRAILKGKANVHRIPTNGGHTAKGLAELDKWLGKGKWDVIHFNWGLHDLKYVVPGTGRLAAPPRGKRVTPVEKYAANLTELVKRMQRTGAKLIFATTTPVPKGAGGRIAGDAKVYNTAAVKVMKGCDVPVNDLYTFALPKLKTLQRPANVHFLSEGSKALASQVAANILKALAPPKPTVKDAVGTIKWTPLAALTDEFNGAKLDETKWHPNNPTWKGRQPGFFSKKNVTVVGGKLNITMKAETLPDLPKGYNTFTCGAVKSKTKVLYGFFEARCRAMDSRGSSAFWFYDSTKEIWTEIDVFEIGGKAPKHERAVHMNVHVFHTPTEKKHWSKASTWKAPYRLADDYHTYGLDWSKESIKFYIDGVLRRTVKNTHWHQPLYLNFDSETMPKWFGLPKKENLPSTFSIDYIRAWKRAE
ncbi:MAG: family 16 glycosylhydrolase [Phycisphaerae bacterium]|jgi:beta-glucanase (GH16 family)|nr:family 16 glycosylhydrolase [Phycisphaerae bacterium]